MPEEPVRREIGISLGQERPGSAGEGPLLLLESLTWLSGAILGCTVSAARPRACARSVGCCAWRSHPQLGAVEVPSACIPPAAPSCESLNKARENQAQAVQFADDLCTC